MDMAALVVQGTIAVGVAVIAVQFWLARRHNKRMWDSEVEQLKYLAALELNQQAIEHEQLREQTVAADMLAEVEKNTFDTRKAVQNRK